jgi:hypothetical protein
LQQHSITTYHKDYYREFDLDIIGEQLRDEEIGTYLQTKTNQQTKKLKTKNNQNKKLGMFTSLLRITRPHPTPGQDLSNNQCLLEMVQGPSYSDPTQKLTGNKPRQKKLRFFKIATF